MSVPASRMDLVSLFSIDLHTVLFSWLGFGGLYVFPSLHLFFVLIPFSGDVVQFAVMLPSWLLFDIEFFYSRL